MSARRKLNIAVINGALIVAALVGFHMGSPTVFLVVAVVLISGCLYVGDIRTAKGKR